MFGTQKDGGVSGMEMMLKSLGFGPALEAMKQMATNGTLEKIVEFSEKADKILKAVERAENHEYECAACGHKGRTDSAGAGAAGIAPGASAADGGVITAPLRLVGGSATPGSGD